MNDILITIFAQDRKSIVIVKAGKFEVTRNLGGGKDGKYALMIGNALDLNSIGYFPDEKTALDELEKIFAAIEAGEKTYKVN